MKNQTIFQVDPIALRQKLRKLGIGPGIPLSPTFAEDAVRDCLNLHAGQAEIVAEDTEIHGSVTGDVDCTCPKCGHEWAMDEVELESDDIEVPADAIEDSVFLEFPSRTMPPEVGTLVLEPAELAYCLHNWAMLWEVPA